MLPLEDEQRSVCALLFTLQNFHFCVYELLGYLFKVADLESGSKSVLLKICTLFNLCGSNLLYCTVCLDPRLSLCV